ncbi:MAG TPA: hypothetical protein PK332_01680 [Chitinophagales bacterium]|nr:hypothetical protein [Chitinophagales bacterium]HNO01529.1 hypothetical protein [Chitinophagales bacterium]
MKKILTIVFLGLVVLVSAQNTNYTVNNLSPELTAITENVKKEANLNPEQFKKFKADYVLFLNENAKPNANTNTLFMLLGLKFRGYMNDGQFSKVTQMVKDGKLNPPGNKTDLTKSTNKPTTPANTSASVPKVNGLLPASISNQSNVTALFEQLQSFMKITPEKAAQVIPILKSYDKQLTKIKTDNNGNAAKIKQLTDALNGQTVPQLKQHMTDQQIATLVLALGMQENILSGKNLNAEQKIFLDKIRHQYQLNDVQTMSVVLVLVQGKIRGDAIALLHKSNPEQAGKEFLFLLQDLDKQLQASLTNEQYVKVKADIEKLLKGQKL